jgi:uncharacterized repeat protein (TIGR01451 family)
MFRKILALTLVFTLTFANPALITKSFAASIFESAKNSTGTGSKNIEFDASFNAEVQETSVVSDVNNSDLAIYLRVNVKNNGYLKNGKIKITEVEEGEGINYNLQDQDLSELNMIENIEDNVVNLRQVDSGSDVLITLPIKYQNEEYVDLSNLSKPSKVVFTGTYVNSKGIETEVTKELELTVSWKDEREVKINSEITKYIPYNIENSNGIILQNEIDIDTSAEVNTLPVKSSEVKLKIPTLQNIKPSTITIVAVSTAGTNGKTDENVVFGDNNWSYNEEEGILTIYIENEKQLVQIEDKTEDNGLVDGIFENAEKTFTEEERYYSLSGIDKYLITYSYENISIEDELKLNSNVEAKVEIYSGDEENNNSIIKDVNESYEYELEGQKGNIASLEINNETEEVSKAYTYLNYNNEENYTMNFNSKVVVNVSYKDIVEGMEVADSSIYYTAKDGTTYETNDIKYKQLTISKENFNNVLGENGTIKISDLSGKEVLTINNETPVDENGNIIINIEENNLNKIKFAISSPVQDGNLIINVERIMTKSSYNKEEYKEFSNVTFESKMSAKYSYVSNETNISTNSITTNLKDTETKANIVLDRDSLSTIAENENVEIRVELNNHIDTSDVYGKSQFEIEMPAYIEKMEITNTSIVYGEGLEISNLEAYDDAGIIKIRVTLDGTQSYLNSGVLTNGCNIVINSNIKVNLFAPAMDQEVKLTYINDEATNYENGQNFGEDKAVVTYSAPSGLLTINSTKNFDDIGSMVTSVRQGTQVNTIDIYAEEKTATMEVIVMNNNKNTISNLSILGRIPFKGVKDIASGEDLGTTVDTTLVSTLSPDAQNRGDFIVYYSANPEATKDLNDSQNGWTTDVSNLAEMKSYLIVPTDSNYVMEESEVLRFTYQYKIPGNLEHNTDIFGTFLAYYTNNTEIATIDETSTADKVGLTTGEGPQVDLVLSKNVDTVKEFEDVKFTATVTNTGKTALEDVVVKIPLPKYTKYSSSKTSIENVKASVEDGVAVFNLGKIEVNGSVDVELIVSVTNTPETVTEISTEASITVKDLQKELKTSTITVNVAQAEFTAEISTVEDNADGAKVIYKEGNEYYFDIVVTNLVDKVQENTVLTMLLPEEFEFERAYMVGYEDDGITSKELDVASFDQESNKIIWNIGNIDGNDVKQCRAYITVNNLEQGITQKLVSVVSEVKADGTETYKSNEAFSTIARPDLVISQTTNTTNTYVKEGESIEYVFTIKNQGIVAADNVSFKDAIPDGLIAKSIEYTVNGIPVKKSITAKDSVEINTTINPGSELTATVRALAIDLDGVQEKTVTNVATVSANNVNETKTNSITHIVEATDKSNLYDTEGESAVASSQLTNSTSSSNNIVKTYKITGIAWLDSNGNGKRDDSEQRLNGITVRLINSDTSVIEKTVSTNSKGEYTFTGVANGNYLVIFEYDTVTYTVTTYKQSGVETNVNSDALTTKIEQDGKQRNGAVTDIITIQDLSVSNIDIGLVLADTFDLSLDKVVTKVTAQNKASSSKAEYTGTKLAKMDIAGKYIASTTVYVEYKITVTNNGDVAGYAKKVVDYIPEGMTFNSSMNKDWYTGTDGNLYTSSLADVELKPGESRELSLVLTKQMTTSDTTMLNNNAEIYEDFNIYGISDKNSTPNNKIQNENDMSSADTILTIKTGETLIYTSVIITSIILGSIVAFIVSNKIVVSRRKRGV